MSQMYQNMQRTNKIKKFLCKDGIYPLAKALRRRVKIQTVC